MRRKQTNRKGQAWLESLQPDDVSRRRMRRAIMDRARPILERREADWYDVAAAWATILAPIAAMITLIFMGIALQASDRPGETATAVVPVETAPIVADPDDLAYALQVATMVEAP